MATEWCIQIAVNPQLYIQQNYPSKLKKLKHSQKCKILEFVTTTPSLQEILKAVLQVEKTLEGNWNPYAKVKSTGKGKYRSKSRSMNVGSVCYFFLKYDLKDNCIKP